MLLATSNNSGDSRSLWMDVQLPSFPPLRSNRNADVCVVGAGIAGLTCAYTLAKAGHSVIVLDQGPIAGGQTARTTAHLTWVLDERYCNLEKFFGEEGARLAADSHAAAIDYIEKIILTEGIDCDFDRLDGYLFVPPEESIDILEKEFIAIQKTGKAVFKAPRAPFSSSFNTGTCLHFPKQAQFHILKYLQGLVKAIVKYGGEFFCHTHVNHFEEGAPNIVSTPSGEKVSSSSVIVATGTPINNRFFIHTKQAPYRTYVIAASVPKDSITKGLYWDTADPYHYIRLQKNLTDPHREWLIVGGADHKTGQDAQINAKYEELEKWAREHFQMMDAVEYHWSGQVYEPVDSLGFIGKNPWSKNVYIATGDSGNGMTNGTIAGILIPDLILEKDNPWKNLYEPSRKTVTAALEFISEAFNMVSQYRDWLTPGDMQKIDVLPPGEGIILRNGIKKIAVYKDMQNRIHIHSAFCPHLGGCVRWNSGEKSWDCPCHGSRFDGCGNVMNGPAISNLDDLKIKR